MARQVRRAVLHDQFRIVLQALYINVMSERISAGKSAVEGKRRGQIERLWIA